MESRASVTCPFCGVSCPIPDGFSGGLLQCGNCNGYLEMPEDATVKLEDELDDGLGDGADGGTGKQVGDRLWDATGNRTVDATGRPGPPHATPEGTAASTKRCPSCGAHLEGSAIICVSCGFDARTGKRHETAGDAPTAESNGVGTPALPETAFVGSDEPRMPLSVALALGVFAVLVLLKLLQLQAVRSSRFPPDLVLHEPRVILMHVALLMLVMFGLWRASRLAWHAARILSVLGLLWEFFFFRDARPAGYRPAIHSWIRRSVGNPDHAEPAFREIVLSGRMPALRQWVGEGPRPAVPQRAL